ncbi:MAG: hypothetical protein AAF593_12540 [Planctomycetota bacterium]
MKHLVSGFLWCMFFTLPLGCCFPLPDRHLERVVTDSEVVGVWRLTEESLELLTRDGFVPASNSYTLTFHADGSLQFDSIIDEFRGGTYRSSQGTWRLAHNTMGDSNVEKTNVIEIQLRSGQAVQHRTLNFDEEDGQLVLWNYYGDPDSLEFMEYQRLASP